MSDSGGNSKNPGLSSHDKEQAILAAVKKTLTLVIKDTATGPGLKHPLNDDTIMVMRDCLALISSREQELAELQGIEMAQRPSYIDEPRLKKGVVVNVDFKNNSPNKK